jgi:hypothetical protein
MHRHTTCPLVRSSANAIAIATEELATSGRGKAKAKKDRNQWKR